MNVESLRRFKRFRWVAYLIMILAWGLSAVGDILPINRALQEGVSFSEILGASSNALSRFPPSEPWVTVCAGIHLHVFLVSILLGAFVLAGLAYCFKLHDALIEAHDKQPPKDGGEE